MKIFGYRIIIAPERKFTELTAGIKRLRGERNHYKRECEMLRASLMDCIMQDPESDRTIEKSFERLEAAR